MWSCFPKKIQSENVFAKKKPRTIEHVHNGIPVRVNNKYYTVERRAESYINLAQAPTSQKVLKRIIFKIYQKKIDMRFQIYI